MYKVACRSCGKPISVGYEIIPIKTILKQNGAKCKYCNVKLSARDPVITVKPAE
ncbi:MAG: prepilin peptidase [Nitrososphaerota archaeon]|nr:prepilin peptidase [Nitrososphaerota archaeon]MDG7038539.1 prepilin peptidase [Nitrososphaerota archaeon]MDG7045070.1 prepilin peptidase [Nitrososphaerota archaeon]MDG7048140.1 prepilin peptidase [Nitrososphaerota archaeon]MDG7051706.1 prepilin peptidase [Nitrososphaerota archaeon]